MSRTLRLDPSLPLVWRTPDSFQVGVNPAIAIIDSLDSRFLPVLSALRTGISEEGCEAIASHEGLTAEHTRAFLSALGEVLVHKNPEPLPRVAITGSTGNHRVFSQVWAQLGHTLVANPRDAHPADETFVLSNFVLQPSAYQPWISRDLRHTPVIFSDQAITVGPRVTPGEGPCLGCVWDNESRREPALVALASQLTAHTAATDTPAFHALAAWHARELVETDTPGLTLRIDRYTRRTTSHVEEASARCACRSLED